MSQRRMNIYQLVINLGLNELEEYVTEIEDFLEQRLKSFDEWFEEKTKDFSEEDKDTYGEHLSDEYHKLADAFPTTFRSSMLLNIYSFIEKELNQLCFHYGNRKDIRIELNDLRDSGVIRASKYIDKVVGINFPHELTEWKLISGVYRELRNSFAHNGGIIREQGIQKMKEKISDLPVSLNERHGELKLEKEFCYKFIKDARIFFNEFFLDVDQSNQKLDGNEI
ncbi:hypothetical protein [Brevibacillus fortis]|uniref:hypothetical protein n=1 Tax=Brevibacillus fortis TaxID=2126352 RepID=UPI0038FC05DE